MFKLGEGASPRIFETKYTDPNTDQAHLVCTPSSKIHNILTKC